MVSIPPATAQSLSAVDRRSFWQGRRLRFNIALLASGLLAGLAFAAVLVAWTVWPPPPEDFGHADFELLPLVLAPFAFGFAMVLANGLYLLGPVSEALLRPKNADAFRRRTYALGVSVAVALPWLVPLKGWCEFVAVSLQR
jgi:hypothetical protein